jgi:hypothetical protein
VLLALDGRRYRVPLDATAAGGAVRIEASGPVPVFCASTPRGRLVSLRQRTPARLQLVLTVAFASGSIFPERLLAGGLWDDVLGILCC